MDPEVFDKALEQLWIHGGLEVTPDERVGRGRPGWASPYAAQRERKLHHLEQMGRYAEASGCRMRHLVTHFGDVQDSGRPCGLCDVCSPETCVTLRFAEPAEAELSALGRILDSLHERDGQATGRLHRELFGESLPRRDFERLVGGLVRAGLARLSEDSFDKEGQRITFQRLTLTPDGQRTRVLEPELVMLPLPLEAKAAKKRRARLAKGEGRRTQKRRRSGGWEPAAERAAPTPKPSPQLVEALKAWRLDEARRRRIPAFRILTDRVLGAIATVRPRDSQALMAIQGVGPKLVEHYGTQLLALVGQRR